MSGNSKHTNPFDLGTTERNISNAIEHYQQKVYRREQREIAAKKNRTVLKYIKEKEEEMGPDLKNNAQIINFQNKKSLLSERKYQSIERLENFEMVNMKRFNKENNRDLKAA